MKKVAVFDLKFDAKFRKKFQKGCKQIFDEGFLTNHTFVKKFEKKFAQSCGIPHALAVSNGTAALELALRTINVRDKEVILPTNTFIATYVAVKNAGGIPVLVDIEKDSFGIDLTKLKDAVTTNTAAVICVHIGGLLSPHLFDIIKFCRTKKIPLIEDAAHAFGSKLQNQHAGTFGDYGCFSLFTTKTLTAGEGGVMITSSKQNYELAYSIRQFGEERENPLIHIREGSNFKLSEFQALCGILDLERSKKRILQRNKLALRYQKNLANTSWSTITPARKSTSCYYKQIITSPASHATVKKHLARFKIATTGSVYQIPLHQQPICQPQYKHQSFPVSDWFSKFHFCPPCYPELTLSDIDYVCSSLLKFKP